jgi:hypothetical protein
VCSTHLHESVWVRHKTEELNFWRFHHHVGVLYAKLHKLISCSVDSRSLVSLKSHSLTQKALLLALPKRRYPLGSERRLAPTPSMCLQTLWWCVEQPVLATLFSLSLLCWGLPPTQAPTTCNIRENDILTHLQNVTFAGNTPVDIGTSESVGAVAPGEAVSATATQV